jgi:MFS family permease
LTAAKLLLGFFYDRFGTKLGNIFIGICCIGFPVFALLAKSGSWAPWLFGIMLGITGTGVSVPVTVLLAKHFGQKDFPSIYSVFSMMTTLASAIALPMIGGIYDSFGNYHYAWIILLIIGAISAVALIISDKLPLMATVDDTQQPDEAKYNG